MKASTYVIREIEVPSESERRYRISPVDDCERLLWLRYRPDPPEGGGFAVEVDCLSQVQSENRFHLLPSVVAHEIQSGAEILVLDRSFGPRLSDRWEELSDRDTLSLCLEQILLALSKIHRAGFAVSDLRPDSFVWPEDGQIQLVELSRVTPIGGRSRSGYDPPYLAPECTPDAPIGEACDIFAVGAMFAPLLLREEVPPEVAMVDFVEHFDIREPVVTQLVKGAMAKAEGRFRSVDEMRTLVYQLKNERVTIPRPIAATSSTVGISRHRYINEDSAGYQELCFSYQSRPYHLGFYCVADGMGGHELGERASQLAVLGALQAFRQIAQDLSIDFLLDKLPSLALSIGRFASEVVYSGAAQLAEMPRMGTTFTGILVVNGDLALAHVGDSRAILVRQGRSRPLTLDHSLVAALVRVGQMSQQEAETSSERNVLVRCIDALTPMDETDFDSLMAIGIESGRMTVQAGDAVVLMSDGVWGVLGSDDLVGLVRPGGRPQEIADGIVRAAIDAGSDDNATVLVVCWE